MVVDVWHSICSFLKCIYFSHTTGFPRMNDLLRAIKKTVSLLYLCFQNILSCDPFRHGLSTLTRLSFSDISQPVRIVLYSIIFLLSLIGNSIIIIVLLPVGRRPRLRTITNLFLLSLAVSDLMISLVCIPFTLIPNVMKDFIFGLGMCKLVTYFMGM
uniref:G-protein coupled receptors family 1 profile domain-containing protein n=1 Tax=Xiphophorus couchianus TaxID=32473 RepID=A0A3B5KUU2_9TELE